MSIFNPDSDDDHETIDTSEITLDALVGEGQKYKTPDELAKAYVHSDAFIAQLKKEKLEKDAELKVLKDLVESREKKTVEGGDPPPGEQRQEDPPVVHQPKSGEEKDLSTLVAEELERQKKETSFAENVNAVSEKLAAHFGGERQAKEAIARKAKELNVGTDWLMDVAGRSPNAFYSTIGLDQRSFATPNAGGDVNTASFGRDTNRRNFKYFEEIRKTNPKAYYSAQTQREMFAAAREQGDKFYT